MQAVNRPDTLPAPPGYTLAPLAHQQPDVAAGIVAVLQAAHEQEAQWLQRPSQPQHLPRVADIQASPHLHLGAVQGGVVVGVLVLGPDDEPGQISIQTLAVHPSAQRQGIARALVQETLRRGPGTVFAVAAATGNTAALALYRSLGFVPYRQGLLGSAKMPITKLRR